MLAVEAATAEVGEKREGEPSVYRSQGEPHELWREGFRYTMGCGILLRSGP